MHPLIQKLEIQLNKEVEKKCEGIVVTLDLVRQIGPEVIPIQGLNKLGPSVLKKTKITQFFEVRGEQTIGENERYYLYKPQAIASRKIYSNSLVHI